MRLRIGLFASLTVISLIPSLARAMVAPIKFHELVANSEVIVVAQVTKIDIRGKDEEIATARVVQTWKGTPGAEVRFLASPTWTCDISDAEIGEHVVLFLTRSKDSAILIIAHSGRGRMPLREVEGKSYATIWADDVILPEGTSTLPGPKPEYDFIKSIDISVLKKMVRQPNP